MQTLAKPEPDAVVISTWLPLDDATEIRARAAAADRSIAAEVRRALRSYLNDNGASAKGAAAEESGMDSRRART